MSQPHASSLPAKYKPAEHETAVRARWESTGAFHADPARVLSGEKLPYSIFIPPPNVTARLHLGHALNNTLQDILARVHRMKGFEVLWMPGTDHAGIGTQAVVERRIQVEEGKRRTDFTREGFIARVQAWKDEYERAITDQLKAIGCSCDWQRQRFTMDDICARAVREAFFILFRDGLIYRGKRLVNWDPVNQTALADDEVEMEEIDGFFYYLRYPLVRAAISPSGTGLQPVSPSSTPVTWSELARLGYPGASHHPPDQPAWITVATTRPETYLGDTAVALNPKDPRATALENLSCQLPLVGRVIPIIKDDYVVMPSSLLTPGGTDLQSVSTEDPKAKYATGFLKVTPAHDPNDEAIGRRHNLPSINVLAPDASISDKHGWTDLGDAHLFLNLSREQARDKVVAEFKARGLLEKQTPYRHAVGHSYRSHVPIEPYLSDQWYCKVTDDRLRGSALRAMNPMQRSASPPASGGTDLQSVSSAPTASGGTDSQSVSTASASSSPAGIPEALTIHRRHLPHWQMGGRTYFVTFRVKSGRLSDTERRIALDACAYWHGERVAVHLITVMPDHVHILITPLKLPDGSWEPLPPLIQSIKRHSAREINKSRGVEGALWQDEYFDRIIRHSDEFAEKWNYMVHNPVKAGIVGVPQDYRFTYSPEHHDNEPPGRWSGRASRVPGKPERERGGRERSDGLQTRPTEGTETASTADGGLTFFPERYAKTFESWHENLRDWCISRQLWWGHQIPVWHKRVRLTERNWVDELAGKAGLDDVLEGGWPGACAIICKVGESARVNVRWELNPVVKSTEGEYDIYICALDETEMTDFEKYGYRRDPDVLDTWFSSALWPISTLGWPDPPADMQGLLGAFNPSAVLCTARDIITLWVSRMVMFNRYFLSPSFPLPGGTDLQSVSSASAFSPGRLPFHHVYINPVVQDGHGQRMSKSLGNGVDPLDIVHSHGTDALRLILCQMATSTQDVRMPVDLLCPHCEHAFEPVWITSPAGYKVAAPNQTCPACKKKMLSAYGVSTGSHKPTAETPLARNSSTKFDAGRNFCTKLWNATRFALMNLEGASASAFPSPPSSSLPPLGGTGLQPVSSTSTPLGGTDLQSVSSTSTSSLPLPDRWMLSRLARTIQQADAAIADYQFARYAEAMYDLFWRDFCDWYLEAIKPTVKSTPAQQAVLRHVLDSILRLLHPITPYVTEVLFNAVKASTSDDLLCLAAWPTADASHISDDAERDFARLQLLVDQIRQVRAAKGVEPRRRVTLYADADTARAIASWTGLVEALAGVEGVVTTPAGPADAPFVFEGRPCALSNLIDASDPADERKRLTEAVSKLEKDISVIEGRLNNPGYAAKAPPHLVAETRGTLTNKQTERDALRARLAELN